MNGGRTGIGKRYFERLVTNAFLAGRVDMGAPSSFSHYARPLSLQKNGLERVLRLAVSMQQKLAADGRRWPQKEAESGSSGVF